MQEVELPFRLISVFETFAIYNCFQEYEDMEKWLNEKHLEIVSSYQIGNYICFTATLSNIKFEKII